LLSGKSCSSRYFEQFLETVRRSSLITISLDGIDLLVNLKILICKENRVEQCSELTNPQLEILDLQKNQLSNFEQIKIVVGNLKNLKKLDLRDNCFIDEPQLKNSILKVGKSLEKYNNEIVKPNAHINDTESKY
jgi:Leucine-rich repeat (LRR) protein